MSKAEYSALQNALSPQEEAEQQELLRGVDLKNMSSVESAAAHRVAKEIKRCAEEEVKQYLAR